MGGDSRRVQCQVQEERLENVEIRVSATEQLPRRCQPGNASAIDGHARIGIFILPD